MGQKLQHRADHDATICHKPAVSSPGACLGGLSAVQGGEVCLSGTPPWPTFLQIATSSTRAHP